MLSVRIDVREIEGAALLFQKFPERLKKYLRQANQAGSADLLKAIQANLEGANGGPRRRTGALKRAWKLARLVETSTGFIGGAGASAEAGGLYARYQDQGFHGTEHVRAFIRRVKTRDLREQRRRIATGIGYVRAHSRIVNYEGRPYVAPAVRDTADQIRQRHVDAIRRAIADTGPT